jgi:hypothetical protein
MVAVPLSVIADGNTIIGCETVAVTVMGVPVAAPSTLGLTVTLAPVTLAEVR